MDPGFVTLMRKLAPDLIDEITRRALILERIAVMQPVGRWQLAAKLNLPEREIRNTAAILKDLGYIDLDASGMSLSDKADEVLETSRAFSKAMSGLAEMESRLCELLPADRVLIAPGNADEDGFFHGGAPTFSWASFLPSPESPSEAVRPPAAVLRPSAGLPS